MKQEIHPDYVETQVTCSCGNTFTTRSVKPDLHVELCNMCHPFYTGKQKLVDTGGRVERFQRKYAKRPSERAAAPEQTETDDTGGGQETERSPDAAPEPSAPE